MDKVCRTAGTFRQTEPSVVRLVVPTGYSFNLDAFSIYLTLAVVFIAQATNTPLSLGDLLLVLAVSLVTSKGAHGVPGSAIVILAARLNAVPTIPAIGLSACSLPSEAAHDQQLHEGK